MKLRERLHRNWRYHRIINQKSSPCCELQEELHSNSTTTSPARAPGPTRGRRRCAPETWDSSEKKIVPHSEEVARMGVSQIELLRECVHIPAASRGEIVDDRRVDVASRLLEDEPGVAMETWSKLFSQIPCKLTRIRRRLRADIRRHDLARR